MIKILNTTQIRELDEYTIRNEPVASIDLMERACRAFCSWFTDHFDPTNSVGIVCGTGNNGGDGLGIARMLLDWDYPVKVWVVIGGGAESEDYKVNLKRLTEKIPVNFLQDTIDALSFDEVDILIDAVFGSGLSRPVTGVYADAIGRINETKAIRVAVDIPSGLLADIPSTGAIVKAHHTVSFQMPKLAFFFPSTYAYTGQWCTVGIGLHKQAMDAMHTEHFLLTRKDMSALLKPYHKFDHKGTHGRALLIAGGYGKMGAAVLAARGLLRTGIGLITVHVPKAGYNIIQTAVPEAIVSIDNGEHEFTTAPDLTPYDAVGIGPGLGQSEKTVNALGDVLRKVNKPVVLDADAINGIGAHRELISVIPKGSILTPHPKEFERIAGTWKNDFERLELQKEFSVSNQVVVVLKGAHTSISSPDRKIYFNDTGNPGMASGGTGDVLTGIITAFLAAGYPPLQAAQLGVFLHGLSGDEAARKRGVRGLTASDLIDHLASGFALLT